jgi:hypothetical protein
MSLFEGCMDKRVPIEDRPIVIPHQMYFGNVLVQGEERGWPL